MSSPIGFKYLASSEKSKNNGSYAISRMPRQNLKYCFEEEIKKFDILAIEQTPRYGGTEKA